MDIATDSPSKEVINVSAESTGISLTEWLHGLPVVYSSMYVLLREERYVSATEARRAINAVMANARRVAP